MARDTFRPQDLFLRLPLLSGAQNGFIAISTGLQAAGHFPVTIRSDEVVCLFADAANVRSVPHSCPSWTFYIGGYQPAQKWLKDRKGRALAFDPVKHIRKS